MPSDVVLKDARLRALIKAFSKVPSVRVGVIDGKTRKGSSAQGKSKTNAEIGAIHEYGQNDMPERSFLRVPISENLEKYMEKNGQFNEEMLKKVTDEKSLVTFMKSVGITAEQVVAEAFATEGFGSWKKSNMEHKKVHMTLTESQQLRNSISSEVE